MPRGRPKEFDVDKALDAALELFWRHGYEGTSIAMLTHAMNLNVPSLYGAFGNKEALFRKVLDRYLERPASYLPKALEAATARQTVENLFAGAIGMVTNPGHADGCLLVHGALVAGPSAASIRKELSRRRAGAAMAIQRRLERAVAEGDLPSNVDPAQLARYVVTVIWGLSVQAAGGGTRAELQEVADMALRTWPNASPMVELNQ